ncbi:UDP-N-acetylmuramate dehydrogenase [Pasteurellaceae bacterium LIM206]|nr:UDP-N-acetylmuramate dehydrogenase [Pasteurellaceae bacterium LIM206]
MQNLQPFHTFGVPAKAKRIVEVSSIEQLLPLWQDCQANNEPALLLGQGSNVLFLKDFNGTVFINGLKGIQHSQDSDYHYLAVQGGEVWHDLVQWSLQQHIYGLENLALIPGCAGSAPIQNIGAYGVEFKDVCDYVQVLNLQTGEQFRLSNAECRFSYRDSAFKHRYAKNYMVTAVGLKLAKAWKPVLKYGSLAELDPSAVSPQRVFDEVCAIRKAKLPAPKEHGNAGSFFKNPIITEQQFLALQQEYPNIPHYPAAKGFIKLAAGWLIDQCGLKGYQVGGAAVHQQQALVLINQANATGTDVVELAHHIRQAVAAKFDIYLSPEVRFIGAEGEVNAENAIS